MEFYKKQKEIYISELKKLNRRYNFISLSRLIIAIATIVLLYFILNSKHTTVIVCLLLFCIVEFILLMNRHVLVRNKRLRAEAIVKINEDEIDYLLHNKIPFEEGNEFTDHTHPYSYDLDIFGNKSLFHNINRTQTFKGKQKLAALLKKLLPEEEILLNQHAVKELSGKPEFRQEIMALGKAYRDSEEIHERLLNWINIPLGKIAPLSVIIALTTPALFIISLAIYFITNNSLFSTLSGWIFGFNLVFILSYLKMIKQETQHTTDIHNIIHNYGLIIDQIENEKFEYEKLKSLQDKLVYEGKTAGSQIKKLASLFSKLDSINNAFGAALLNGLMLYHFHALKSLLKWKKEHSAAIILWLDIIAEIEALNSFANLHYNNPDFTFPLLNDENKIEFKNLAHPLLNKEGRIGNNINFDPDFMILTGSNMSGKSTFLRSLGINMILAGAGAPVCAEEANINPLPVLVSMRLSDSLSDSESYFFAEVKRLRFIMDELKKNKAFVLLDEILRGTNSEDKRTGTIKVIKRMIVLNAVGAIATHDIEVCNLTDEYPQKLINRCFEAQIENNELYFDYCLRDGICKNKSATFLMEKMGVI
ncbi:DNA mismatch repair protein [Flavobacterium sp. NRK1]|uniref:MutS-related protein n=1 Tax=Flavobacterium sp. NRK1 TaxID=2954929 RepID=UPI002092D1DC|nr:DNA mismatch repair protein [Flavobacterium sp. NRK1]MCO6149419.1 DNA mismatch repair protein [Flavobacterium sp. NRK1]